MFLPLIEDTLKFGNPHPQNQSVCQFMISLLLKKIDNKYWIYLQRPFAVEVTK
jgi:hypothetical protein